MNSKGQNLISLFLIISLLVLPIPLIAKERRGAEVEIYKTKVKMESPWETQTPDIKGELIAVKANSLLLLDSEGGDVSVDLADIREIKIVGKAKTTVIAGLGLIGGVAGALAGYGGSHIAWQYEDRQFWTLIGGILGAALGGIIGMMLSGSKTIQFEEKSSTEINEILEDLRKKARVSNF